jgi:hypothetical protein
MAHKKHKKRISVSQRIRRVRNKLDKIFKHNLAIGRRAGDHPSVSKLMKEELRLAKLWGK